MHSYRSANRSGSIGFDRFAGKIIVTIEQPLFGRAEAFSSNSHGRRLQLRLLAHGIAGVPGVLIRRLLAAAVVERNE
jgi:hypothetical protein